MNQALYAHMNNKRKMEKKKDLPGFLTFSAAMRKKIRFRVDSHFRNTNFSCFLLRKAKLQQVTLTELTERYFPVSFLLMLVHIMISAWAPTLLFSLRVCFNRYQMPTRYFVAIQNQVSPSLTSLNLEAARSWGGGKEG
jgi:hypothetical protein